MHAMTLTVDRDIQKSVTYCGDNREVMSKQHEICSLVARNFTTVFETENSRWVFCRTRYCLIQWNRAMQYRISQCLIHRENTSRKSAVCKARSMIRG